MKATLDDKDLKILDILQSDSTLSVKDIGEQIGLSFTPTYERIKSLERRGIIKKYVALVDRVQVGLDIVVYCYITLKEQSKEALMDFERIAISIPEIQELISLSGTYDYVMKIVSTDIGSYNNFVVNVVSNIPNIGQYHSSIVLNEVKKETAFKIPK
ncbi:MAG: Lrp/AsnC family transcriptional regulator [Flavobacterium sp.]|nr:Lrp/AsnC family transcriptional regulator [Flavobacterium sp.]